MNKPKKVHSSSKKRTSSGPTKGPHKKDTPGKKPILTGKSKPATKGPNPRKEVAKKEDLLGKYYVFHKPYGYLSQFTKDHEGQLTLNDFDLKIDKDVYPVGRLDKDSEGLLLLTNNKKIVNSLLNPSNKKWKTYWVQLDGALTKAAAKRLRAGVEISVEKKTITTLPAKVKIIDEPEQLHQRVPPVRFRKNIPTTWIEISIQEGKNRQIRKMCASVEFPVLRLIRVQIGELFLPNFRPGSFKEIKKRDFLGPDVDE